jgi:carboxyl-terminal processing protease
MTNNRRITGILFLILLSGLMFLRPGAEALGVESTFNLYGKLNVGDIKKTLEYVQSQYVEEIGTNKLINGALSGIRDLLISKKVKEPHITFVPTGKSAEENISLFNKQFFELLARHGKLVTEEDLIYASLRGMMAILHKAPYDDPYSVVMDSKEYNQLNEQMAGGNFGGVGIYIELDKNNKKFKNQLTVIEPIEDTPADKAGLKAGDMIMKIDEFSTTGIKLDMAQKRIRGPIGSIVRLSILRKGWSSPREFKVARALIHVKVASSKLLDGNIGYIKLRVFGSETDEEFEKAYQNVERLGARALIIDLRNNGGGYIDAARDVCSKFMERGALIVSTVNYRTKCHEVIKSSGNRHRKLPLVVLVNKYSASASEITAGALKDTKTAVLVGTKTFGKASVQSIKNMSDGGALKLTIAHYLTPMGRNINKKGIMPDVAVEMNPMLTDTPKDIQLNKAVDLLKKRMAAN